MDSIGQRQVCISLKQVLDDEISQRWQIEPDFSKNRSEDFNGHSKLESFDHILVGTSQYSMSCRAPLNLMFSDTQYRIFATQ